MHIRSHDRKGTPPRQRGRSKKPGDRDLPQARNTEHDVCASPSPGEGLFQLSRSASVAAQLLMRRGCETRFSRICYGFAGGSRLDVCERGESRAVSRPSFHSCYVNEAIRGMLPGGAAEACKLTGSKVSHTPGLCHLSDVIEPYMYSRGSGAVVRTQPCTCGTKGPIS